MTIIETTDPYWKISSRAQLSDQLDFSPDVRRLPHVSTDLGAQQLTGVQRTMRNLSADFPGADVHLTYVTAGEDGLVKDLWWRAGNRTAWDHHRLAPDPANSTEKDPS